MDYNFEQIHERSKAQGKAQAPEPIVVQSIGSLPAEMPPVVVDGLLYSGEVLLVGGHSKSWKSWAVLDLLYCIANGLPWLVWSTIQGRVIHVDLELLPAAIRYRFELIRDSYGVGNLDNIDVVALRGKKFGLDGLSRLGEAMRGTRYSMMFLDPVYRMLAGSGVSENDAGTIVDVLNRFLAVGTEQQSATSLLQHFSKGSQAEKESIDRFSGSGVWGRGPDVVQTFTQHQEEQCFSVSTAFRHWEPVNSFAVRWKHPRFVLDKDLDPEDLKVRNPRVGRPRMSSVEALCALIGAEEYISYSDLLRRAQKLCDMKKRTFDRRLTEAKRDGWIYLNVTDATYALSSKYVSRNNGEEP